MLFYNVEGSIQDISTMIITPVEIFLRDIGSKTHTEFTYDEECMEFVEKNDLFTSHHGFIHSHNSMKVFFSPEDQDELQDNAGTHNIYLSLIVNNFMDIIAKVVFLGQPASEYSCFDENGNKYELELSDPEKIMFSYDCKILMPPQEFNVSEEFKNIYTELSKKTQAKLKAIQASNINNVNRAVGQAASGATGYNSWGKSEGYRQDFNTGLEMDFDFQDHRGIIEDIEPEDEDSTICQYDAFFSYCLNGGAHTLMDIMDIIEDVDYNIQLGHTTNETISNQVVSNYALYYQCYFDTEVYGTDEIEFRDCANEFIIMCEQLKKDYEWLELLEIGLKLILSKFEQFNLNKHNTNDTKI